MSVRWDGGGVNQPRSRGPATGRRAWLLARRLRLLLVAAGDGGLLCVELTPPLQCIETLASSPEPIAPSQRERERQGNRQELREALLLFLWH